jgi:hypothetical protein
MKHIEMHDLSSIDLDLLITEDEDGENVTNTFQQLLIEEVDLEGDISLLNAPCKNDTDRAFFISSNQ